MDGERDWLERVRAERVRAERKELDVRLDRLGHFIEPGEKQRLVDIAAVVGALG